MDAQIDQALRLIPYGIYLLITGPKGKEKAMVVSWVSQVSYSPPLLVVGLRHNRPVLNCLQEGSLLSLNLLKREHESFVPFLKNLSWPKLPGLSWQRGIEDILYLKEALASWLCEVYSLIPTGDHVMVINKIKTAYAGSGVALTTIEYGKTYLGQK